MMLYEDNNYLAHHGVPGMKWGVRKYQNEDGTLTAEGRKHYNIGEVNRKIVGNKDKPASARIASLPQKAAKENKHKKLSQMSDQEIREKINRMQLEKQYKQLRSETGWRKGLSEVKKVANNISDKKKNKGNNKGGKDKSFARKAFDQVLVATALKTLAGIATTQYRTKFTDMIDKHKERSENNARDRAIDSIFNSNRRSSAAGRANTPSIADYIRYGPTNEDKARKGLRERVPVTSDAGLKGDDWWLKTLAKYKM